MDKPSLGVAICMGDRGPVLEEAEKVLEEYRGTINKYLGWVMEKPERMKELENIHVVYGENFIDDKIIGAVSSILLTSLPNPEKPLIAYANVTEEGVAKISARAIDTVTSSGVNLGEIMRVAAERCGGNGGGHDVAAGAQIPIEKVDEFIGVVNDLVGECLRGRDVGS
jgi:RecJ-like exonuclease